MFRLISQDGDIHIPFDETILKLEYKKLDDDDDDTSSDSKTKKKAKATKANPKRYTIDAYVNGYENNPIVMAIYTKQQNRDYVMSELYNAFVSYSKAIRGEFKSPNTLVSASTPLLKNDMRDLKPTYRFPHEYEVDSKL